MASAIRRLPASRTLALGFSTLLTAGLLSAAWLTPAARAAPLPGPTTIAVLGDTPYGDAQRAQFPRLIAAVDADPAIRLVLHAGDIKDGTTPCSDARLGDMAELFRTFDDPVVLTPGDNEWTDCHRAGGYLPTERLTAVRRLFFATPGQTLGGAPMTVATQGRDQPVHSPYVENVRFTRSGVVFATVHVVGSNNDLTPWSGMPSGDHPVKRQAEFDARRAANLAWIDAAFDNATGAGAYGVVLLMQAEPTATPAYQAERDLIAQRTSRFGRPVLLIHGDEHRYEVESGYAGVANLTRLETHGVTTTDWLTLTVDPRRPWVFSWQSRRVG